MSRFSKRIRPSMVTSSMRSLSRLMQRRSVDLPQPEGPMKAVIWRSGISSEIAFRAIFLPYQRLRASISRIGLSIAGRSAGSPAAVGSDTGR